MGRLLAMLSPLFRVLNRVRPWHRFPSPLALLNLIVLRRDLRWKNLFDTQRAPPPEPAPGVADRHAVRTADGSFNDPASPGMGQAYARFGRNAPLPQTYGEQAPAVLDPNPRLISNRLLARDGFKPVPHLNVLVPAWLQFMVHDWFAHEANVRPDDETKPADLRRPFEVPLGEGDDWHERPMRIRKTPPDPGADGVDEGRPTAYRNSETHWWDASQLYGSSADRIREVRADPATGATLADGKLALVDGHLPRQTVGADIGRPGEVELAGVNGNWWLGLSIFHTLFVREHNLLCDHLKAEYPEHGRDGDWLFEKARLIVAALLAKIHTVEWTPAVLNTTVLRFAMRANWWGLLGEEFERGFGRIIRSEVMGGIPQSPPEHHAAPYAMTEEFAAVYRMHALMPDDYDFRRAVDDDPICQRNLLEIAGGETHRLYDEVSFADAIYSLGTRNPGLLVLHNYPNTLRNLAKQVPSQRTVDVAAIDILRDRERGVPRYCAFRRMLRMPAPRSFVELTGGDRATAAELEAVYGDVEKVDLLVGCAAEKWPEGFGFSDTAFRIFILMASRRLKSDRFYTTDFTEAVYTPLGMQWIRDNSMITVLLRHVPELGRHLSGKRNAFFDWRKRV